MILTETQELDIEVIVRKIAANPAMVDKYLSELLAYIKKI